MDERRLTGADDGDDDAPIDEAFDAAGADTGEDDADLAAPAGASAFAMADETDEGDGGWGVSEDAVVALETDSPVERLRGLVFYITENLVDSPDQVDVTVEQRGSAVHLQVRVAPDDLGKVIGRQGRVARAMRTALMIAGSRYHLRTSLAIEE